MAGERRALPFQEIVLKPQPTDTIGQRLVKEWIRPRRPFTPHPFMESMRRRNRANHFRNDPSLAQREQTRLTLQDTSMESLVDYATDKSWRSERQHLVTVGIGGIYIAAGAAVFLVSPILASLLLGLGSILVLHDFPGVVLSRYSRARAIDIINRKLQQGKTINAEKYVAQFGNPYNLRLNRKG